MGQLVQSFGWQHSQNYCSRLLTQLFISSWLSHDCWENHSLLGKAQPVGLTRSQKPHRTASYCLYWLLQQDVPLRNFSPPLHASCLGSQVGQVSALFLRKKSKDSLCGIFKIPGNHPPTLPLPKPYPLNRGKQQQLLPLLSCRKFLALAKNHKHSRQSLYVCGVPESDKNMLLANISEGAGHKILQLVLQRNRTGEEKTHRLTGLGNKSHNSIQLSGL